jgi:isoquinoline 1-oxidoreductase alpha subunit
MKPPIILCAVATPAYAVPTGLAIVVRDQGENKPGGNVDLQINGKLVRVEADPAMPLLWLLRDVLDMTGTKYGCGIAACGACTVRVDGKPVLSCVTPASALQGRKIQTIEALGTAARPHPLQTAWIAEQVPQCGYCQSGMLMAAAALLERKPKPTDADIDEAIANLCRCGTYQRVRAAIHRAAGARPAPAAPPAVKVQA